VTTSKVGFGEHLRREREMRGISLDEISSATRIGTRFLEAMETEQWNQLPGGVFNRGFVRAVAHHLGLDEESLIAEYTLATGDQAVSSSSVARVSAMPESTGRWVSLVLIVIVVAGLAFAAWYGWKRYAAHRNRTQSFFHVVPHENTSGSLDRSKSNYRASPAQV
jgi:cytoskeletal protein RodZ